MYTLDQHAQPHPEVVDMVLEDGETVLLHLERTTYYSLNSTGTQIWQGLKQGLPLWEVSQRLQAASPWRRTVPTAACSRSSTSWCSISS